MGGNFREKLDRNNFCGSKFHGDSCRSGSHENSPLYSITGYCIYAGIDKNGVHSLVGWF